MSSGNNSNNLTNIKDLKPGMHSISLQFIVLEKNQPTTTKENQVICKFIFSFALLAKLYKRLKLSQMVMMSTFTNWQALAFKLVPQLRGTN